MMMMMRMTTQMSSTRPFQGRLRSQMETQNIHSNTQHPQTQAACHRAPQHEGLHSPQIQDVAVPMTRMLVVLEAHREGREHVLCRCCHRQVRAPLHRILVLLMPMPPCACAQRTEQQRQRVRADREGTLAAMQTGRGSWFVSAPNCSSLSLPMPQTLAGPCTSRTRGSRRVQ